MSKDGPTTVSEFTPTQRAMLAVLSDGLPHTLVELHACLPDELGAMVNASMHISNLRKKLRKSDEDIICQVHGRDTFYRHVRLSPPLKTK